MTPYQHQFPFFLDIDKLQGSLKDFGLISWIIENHLQNQVLTIGHNLHGDPDSFTELITISYGETIMVQNNKLFAWKKYDDGLEIRQWSIDKTDIAGTMLVDFIEIEPLQIGTQTRVTELSYDHLIAFLRKPNLVKQEAFHDNYVVVLLRNDQVTIIPMNGFNATGGDPPYVWPAVASLDLVSGRLYGNGMRMGAFEIELGTGYEQFGSGIE